MSRGTVVSACYGKQSKVSNIMAQNPQANIKEGQNVDTIVMW